MRIAEQKPAPELHGAVVLVTGGTRGIGRAITRGFLAAGCKVVVCGRTAPERAGGSQWAAAAGRAMPPERAGAAEQELPARPDLLTVQAHDPEQDQAQGQELAPAQAEASFMPCDIRDPLAVERLFESIAAGHGRLDVLVNNAGGSPPVDAATAPARLTEKIVQLNLLGALYCAQAANRLMQQQATGGSIINIASVSGERPSPGTAAYGAAKAGLLSATCSLAIEWGPKVRVNAIVVGLVDNGHADEHYGGPAGIERISDMIPLKRFGRPQDVAAACLYLASPTAAYVSGAKLAVHGGGEPPAFLYLARP